MELRQSMSLAHWKHSLMLATELTASSESACYDVSIIACCG